MDGADKVVVGCAKLRARLQKVLRDNGKVLEGSSRLTDNLHAFWFIHIWSIAIFVRETLVGKAFGICLCHWDMVGWKSCIFVLKVYFLRQNPMSMLAVWSPVQSDRMLSCMRPCNQPFPFASFKQPTLSGPWDSR